MNEANSNQLLPNQVQALDHVAAKAAATSNQDTLDLRSLFERNKIQLDIATLQTALLDNARIDLNFHPDRLVESGLTVAASLLDSGLYGNQFETGISNGGLVSFQKLDRSGWENSIFGDAYLGADLSVTRPKYGTLNVFRNADGGAPRFGSCHFQISPEVYDRVSFTFGDTSESPSIVGTASSLLPIVRELFESTEREGCVLGHRHLSVQEVLDIVRGGETSRQGMHSILDDYIEAQIHGDLRLDRDIVKAVLDPSFKGSLIEEHFDQIQDRYGIEVKFHDGYRLEVKAVPVDFRGPEVKELADLVGQRFTNDGVLTPAVLGIAERSILGEPETWSSWSDPQEGLQRVKKLWHAVAFYGRNSDPYNVTRSSTLPGHEQHVQPPIQRN